MRAWSGGLAGAAAPAPLLDRAQQGADLDLRALVRHERAQRAGRGAFTSTVTLSVSSSTSGSSAATASPAFFSQRATVAVVTLSPSVGTLMSAGIDGSFVLLLSVQRQRAGHQTACCAAWTFAKPVAGLAAASRPT